MDYLKYNKYMLRLEEMTRAREMSLKFKKDPDANLKGFAKLETGNRKGMLSLRAQNMKYYEKSEYLYRLILLGKKNGRIIYANGGALRVNRYGHGEIVFNFNPANINNIKNGLHEFSSVVVAGISSVDSDEDMHPLLLAELPTLSGNEKRPEAVDVPSFFHGEDIKAGEREAKPKEGAEAETGQNVPRIYNSYYNEVVKEVCTQIYHNCHLYEIISPFGNGISGIKWHKIMNAMNLPFINATFQFANSDYIKNIEFIDGFVYPSCHDMARKYRHFIFGIKEMNSDSIEAESLRKYYFGIPGMYCREEQPDGGRSGFRYWQPLRGGSRQQNTYGYWIAAVNPDTGDIEEITP